MRQIARKLNKVELRFSSECINLTQAGERRPIRFSPGKENLCAMTENMQADDVQRRKPWVVRCCLNLLSFSSRAVQHPDIQIGQLCQICSGIRLCFECIISQTAGIVNADQYRNNKGPLCSGPCQFGLSDHFRSLFFFFLYQYDGCCREYQYADACSCACCRVSCRCVVISSVGSTVGLRISLGSGN